MILLCILVFMCTAGDDYNGMVYTTHSTESRYAYCNLYYVLLIITLLA